MKLHRRAIYPAFGFSLLFTVGVMAQLPNDDPQNAPLPLPQAATPGDLRLDMVDKDANPFGDDAGKLSRPQTVSAGGKEYSSSAIYGTLATPSFGFIHPFGSFQVTTTTAEGMFMLSATLPFPDGRRTVDFYHALLQYRGKYVDPVTGVSGYLYDTEIGPPVNDKRYILFGDRNLNMQDTNSNGVRWMAYYNGDGKRVYSTTARFYRP